MSRVHTPKATDSVTLSKPNTTSVHILRTKPTQLRQGGLHAVSEVNVSASGKPLISPVPSQTELQARRLSERLELATSTVPWCNSTTPRNYRAPELLIVPARAPVDRTNELPSRIGGLLFYRDGRVTTLNGTPAKDGQ